MKLYREICNILGSRNGNGVPLKKILDKLYEEAPLSEELPQDCNVCIKLGGMAYDRREGVRNTECKYDNCLKAYCNINNILAELERLNDNGRRRA